MMVGGEALGEMDVDRLQLVFAAVLVMGVVSFTPRGESLIL
jgi:hypothetical protein